MNRSLLSDKRGGAFARTLFTLFGLMFALFGLVFVFMTGREFVKANAMQKWIRTPCRITAVESHDRGENFTVSFHYAYACKGKNYTGDHYSQNRDFSAGSLVEVERLKKKFPVGGETHCFVDPASPDHSALRLPNALAVLGIVGFALLFPLFGLGFAILPWKLMRARGKDESASGPDHAAGVPGGPEIPELVEAREKKQAKSTKIFLVLFGAVFTAVGAGLFYPLCVRPLSLARTAKHWPPVEAVVTASKVKSHSSDDGTTYSVYIAYRYSVDGREHLGDRYTFFGGSSSGYKNKAKVVKAHPPGSKITVYVDPADPDSSVIRRELGLEALLGLLPTVFLLVGLGVMIAGWRLKAGRPLDPWQARQRVVRLKGKSPVRKAFLLGLFSTGWCGVVVLLAKSDAPILFPVIFGFLGLVLIGMTVHAVLAIFNPRPNVEITPGDIRPGSEVSLRWWLLGRVDRIRKFTITLRCLKITTETTRSNGKNSTRVVKTPIFEEILLETERSGEMTRGTLVFWIPEDARPTRRSTTGGSEWQLVFHGDIPRWPDLEEILSFLVYPGRKTE